MMRAMTRRAPTTPPTMAAIGVEDFGGSTTGAETRLSPDQVFVVTSKKLKDATERLEEYVRIPL
jgi:hypothetical protein